MEKYTHGMRVCGMLLFALACVVSSHRVLAEPASCKASDKYLSEVTHQILAQQLEDPSCLVDYASIAAQFGELTLVDIRSAPTSVAIDGALSIPLAHLKSKAFLKSNRLLVFNGGFSRIELNQACYELKQHGFKDVKALAGGALVLQQSQARSGTTHGFSAVHPRDFIRELTHAEVIIIAEKTVANHLKALSINVDYLLLGDYEKNLIGTLAAKTGSGYKPVIWVDSDQSPAPSRLAANLPNVYRIAGGVNRLAAYLDEHSWTNHNRTSVPNRYRCPNA